MSILNPRIRPNDNESLCVINSLLKAFKDEIDLRKLPKQFFTVSCFSLKSIGRSNAMVLAFKGHFLLGISFSESELQKFSTSECYKSSYVSLFEIKTTSNKKISMKIFSILTIVNISAFGASQLKRTARNADDRQLEPGSFHRSLENLMRKSIMQDLSTYYDVMLSGAQTLAEVNAVLAKRDPHFIELSQEELDILVSQWLFQMLSK